MSKKPFSFSMSEVADELIDSSERKYKTDRNTLIEAVLLFLARQPENDEFNTFVRELEKQKFADLQTKKLEKIQRRTDKIWQK